MQLMNKQNLLNLYKTENLQATNQWQAIGPHNKGGRTNAIAFNPQNPSTMYLGSASGGLWRSYTGGVGVDGWHYVPTGFPVLGVSTIAIAPMTRTQFILERAKYITTMRQEQVRHIEIHAALMEWVSLKLPTAA